MFRVNIKTTIDSQALGKRLVFDYVHQVDIESTWKRFTDTAKFQFPRRLFFKGAKLQNILKAGDKIRTSFGYDGNYNEEFSGFIARFDANIPLTIYAEDNMYLLKKGSITKGWNKVNLQVVISEMIDYYNLNFSAGLKYQVVDADLGSFRLKECTGAKILQKIKETYGLHSYFRGDTLHVGFAYSTITDPARVRYRFYRNIIKSNLEYRSQEDIKIKVKAISNNRDNSKVTVELGDEDGEVRTLNFFNLSKPDLQKQAEAEMKRMKFDGYRGSINSFGLPLVKHGDIAVISDLEYPERAGSYYVDMVKTSYGIKGIKRIVEPGVATI